MIFMRKRERVEKTLQLFFLEKTCFENFWIDFVSENDLSSSKNYRRIFITINFSSIFYFDFFLNLSNILETIFCTSGRRGGGVGGSGTSYCLISPKESLYLAHTHI